MAFWASFYPLNFFKANFCFSIKKFKNKPIKIHLSIFLGQDIHLSDFSKHPKNADLFFNNNIIIIIDFFVDFFIRPI